MSFIYQETTKAMIDVKPQTEAKVVNAETVRLEAGRQRQDAAGKELLKTQGSLEYGVLLTAVGGLAVRFADEGFQFIEDYAVRLRQVQAMFSPTNGENSHIRVDFVPQTGAKMPAELATQVDLDLQTSEGNLLWRVTGLHMEHPLETSMEVARKLLVKLTEISGRFDSLPNERPAEGNS
jgi:hypothetical protein